ncbi:MAG: hypothetical protein AB7V62_10675 [Thermoleophilia bacterium]
MSGDEAAALRAAAERLEEVAARIREGDATPEELKALADEALALGAEITERVPRVLRPGED